MAVFLQDSALIYPIALQENQNNIKKAKCWVLREGKIAKLREFSGFTQFI